MPSRGRPDVRSAIKHYGGNLLSVILTGMGSDGLDGCRAVVEAGGQVLTQDEQSSVVWGMPGHVTQAGLADAVLPPERIGAEIAQRVSKGRLTGAGAARRIG
ncbi:MAG: chemotaxis protein CheB [Ilumatobacteraceae bacterium]